MVYHEESTKTQYPLSNVILVDEKMILFHQYLRYCHICGSIVFSMASAIMLAQSHFASTIFDTIGLFEYVIYP